MGVGVGVGAWRRPGEERVNVMWWRARALGVWGRLLGAGRGGGRTLTSIDVWVD